MSKATPETPVRKIVTREQFLKPLPRQIEYVPVPEFGADCVIPVTTMFAKERNEYEAYFMLPSGKANVAKLRQVRQLLVVYCCRDEEGRQLFTMDDLTAIAAQQCPVVERLVEAATRINGMKEDVDRLEKNCEATNAV